jgi:DNA-directed RNA polymerase subunit RPC12/RpoP
MQKIALDCQKCGGRLEIDEKTDLFRCAHCGTPYLVKRADDYLQVVQLEERVDVLERDTQRIANGMGALAELPGIQQKIAELEAEDKRKKPRQQLIVLGVGFPLYFLVISFLLQNLGGLGATLSAFLVLLIAVVGVLLYLDNHNRQGKLDVLRKRAVELRMQVDRIAHSQ